MGTAATVSNRHDRELSAWMAIAEQDDVILPPQHPIDELLAEHHLMEAVVAVMWREVQGLKRGAGLRVEVWRDVVEFIGNYVHLCHRRKEEQALLPVLQQSGLLTDLGAAEATRHEHVRAAQLTLELVDGVSAGDWEMVLRVAEQYMSLIRPHLQREEQAFFAPLRRKMSEEAAAALRDEFRRCEAEGLGRFARGHYLAAVRRLCAAAQLDALPSP
ncbi:MAG: hemerythrin domain-containing protein [Deltaproteobacteria bacterium]|nr:hemerythrin domain-containing protein [Deltaproteobacteria bacterium]